MKTVKLLTLMLMAILGMTSCSSDDDDNNKIIIDPVFPGAHTGINTVTVYGQDLSTTITYVITTNNDGTINLTSPEYSLEVPMMHGSLTLGEYTIKNIAYDEEKGGFYRQYGNDGLTVHFTMGQSDTDYGFSEDSYVLIEDTDNGIQVTNEFKLGNMPHSILSIFKSGTTEENQE
ncbi:MAG: hypothetical protein IJP82_07625 [Bacteroidaceae bacterium]|nr:hypothetical protein [Bacteroidaceae bacterium]